MNGQNDGVGRGARGDAPAFAGDSVGGARGNSAWGRVEGALAYLLEGIALVVVLALEVGV